LSNKSVFSKKNLVVKETRLVLPTVCGTVYPASTATLAALLMMMFLMYQSDEKGAKIENAHLTKVDLLYRQQKLFHK
jgi:hypothetical protein